MVFLTVHLFIYFSLIKSLFCVGPSRDSVPVCLGCYRNSLILFKTFQYLFKEMILFSTKINLDECILIYFNL